jgi:putative tryptophan/tyrosine transport system substrate-binding protein
MKRRELVSLLGGAAAWPLVGHAQQPAMPVIGFLNQGLAKASSYLTAAFQKGLNQVGYVEGRNVGIEYRWAEGQYDQLPKLAADLVSRKVAVIVAAFLPAALAAKAVTSTIPICFVTGADPVKQGLVTSLNRPGGNATGVATVVALVGAKRLGLLHEVVPAASTFAVLVNPNNPLTSEDFSRDLEVAAGTLGTAVNPDEKKDLLNVTFPASTRRRSKTRRDPFSPDRPLGKCGHTLAGAAQPRRRLHPENDMTA